MGLAPSQQNDFLAASQRALAPYFILALVVFAAYANIFDNVFLYDDILLIVQNNFLRGWGHIVDLLTSSTTSGANIAGGFYRPVQMFLYLLIFNLGDGSTVWFHFLNLSLHAANTCFVYRLGTKLGFKPWGVFLAALVWGVHPMQTEAVTYMSATSDPLFAFFCLWAIVILAPDFAPKKMFKIIPLFLLGLLSKEAAAIFPLLVMACLFLTSPQRLSLRTYFRTWPLWVLVLIYTVWRIQSDAFCGPRRVAFYTGYPNYEFIKLYSDHLSYRIFTFLATLPSYIGLLFWPHSLHMDHNFPLYNLSLSMALQNAPVMMGVGIVLLSAAQIIRSGKKPSRGIEMSWGLMWFAAAHAPDTGILVPVNSLFLEHWMYLPSVGLFLGLVETAAKILARRPRISMACAALALSVAGLMFFKTYDQNKTWHDPVSLFTNIIDNEHSAPAYGNLGVYYSEKGDYNRAVELLKQSIEISDTMPAIRYNLAITYLQMPDGRSRIQDVIANLQRSLELDPNHYESNLTLGDIYETLLKDQRKADYYHARAKAVAEPAK